MTTWKILFLLILPRHRAENDGIYECGAHGRFEYCIDGIPGCVVGCHCHPGYYFDTETKICEPNTKLTQNYRRQYIPEPTRIQKPSFLSNIAPTKPLPTLTPRNVIDEHVNDIAKDADDLGDWLYNQFFKTIENQVINKTDKDNELTRRSGRNLVPKSNKLKRRARRKGNKHKKKKKGMKGKLLRIAEDDSLFQSSESTDSDMYSSDSSESDSSTESSSDEGHGHKKIVIINKKPRPPLPSFLFLPGMNTPFYPPIGLPPPPVMPMYPMVPVPPVMPAPPMIPYPGNVPECDDNAASTTTVTTTTTTTSTTTSTTEITKANTEESSTKTESDTSVTTADQNDETEASPTMPTALRNHYKGRKRKKIKPLEAIPDEDEEPLSDIFGPPGDSRNKLMKLLRQRIKYPRIEDPSLKRNKKLFDKYMNQLVPPDTLMDNILNDDAMANNENFSPTNYENAPEKENVDFKYLSQLIHRVNENQTRDVLVHEGVQDSPKTINARKWSNTKYPDFNIPFDSGRRMNQNINGSRNQMDDSYYSNLGRQIASLIRTIDADKERQINVEIDQQNTYSHPYFNENGPRTFWERSVRSPLRLFHSFKSKISNPNSSNELLLNIENKVKIVASTVPTLSLQQLENMIKVMETARSQLRSNNKIKNKKPFTKTFNVNLWPKELKQPKKSIKNSITPEDFNVKRRHDINYSTSTRPKILYNKQNNIALRNLNSFPNQVKMYKMDDVFTKRGLPVPATSKNISRTFLKPLSQIKNQWNLHSIENRHRTMKPTILNYKNIKKYFVDSNNQYSFQNDDVHLHYLSASRSTKQNVNPLVPSPFLHQEISHIDYIP